jgi:hypothetical protein
MFEFKSTREILDEVCALDDRAKVEFEDWWVKFAKFKRRQQQQRQPMLIRKIYEGDQASLPTPVAQPQVIEMSEHDRWNQWAASHVDVLRQEVVRGLDGSFAAVFEVIERQQAELADLRNELSVLQYEIKEKDEQCGCKQNGYRG